MVAEDVGRRRWRLLGWSFLAGALWDIFFGIGVLAAPGRLAPLLGVVLPPDHLGVYPDLNGLLLVGLGLMYLQVFRDPRRFAPIAAVATLLRFGGFALLYADVLAGRGGRFFWAVGTADAILGLVHLGLLRLAAGSLTLALLGKERAG